MSKFKTLRGIEVDYIDRNEKAKTGKRSIFNTVITNTLGIEAMEQRNRLKNFAIQHSDEYTELRGKVFSSVVKTMVEEAHETIWNLLAEGVQPDGSQIMVNGAPWSPKMPDQMISTIANGYGESMMHAFQDIMSKVMPSDYKDLADDKQIQIGKLNTALGSRGAGGSGAGSGSGAGAGSGAI